jgi:hypothetical protein
MENDQVECRNQIVNGGVPLNHLRRISHFEYQRWREALTIGVRHRRPIVSLIRQQRDSHVRKSLGTRVQVASAFVLTKAAFVELLTMKQK